MERITIKCGNCDNWAYVPELTVCHKCGTPPFEADENGNTLKVGDKAGKSEAPGSPDR